LTPTLEQSRASYNPMYCYLFNSDRLAKQCRMGMLAEADVYNSMQICTRCTR